MPREKKPRLKKRKDGRYRCVYKGIPFYSYNSDDEAFALREEYKRQLQAGLSKQATVAQYGLPWLKRTFPAVADTTYTGLAIHLQHLIDSIGDKQICDVVPSDLKQVYKDHYLNLSNSYIKSARQLFCSLFDSAVADGLCRSNPARDKTAKPHKGNKPQERILSPEQRTWINTLCTDHRAWPIVMTMLYAGVRPQEAKAINIDRDVDFVNKTITVQETAHRDGQRYEYTEEMKTDWSYRVIPLFPPLEEALKGRHGSLITSAHGEKVTPTTWRVAWNSYIFEMETAINGIQKRWYGRTKEHQAILAEAARLEKAKKKKEAEAMRRKIPEWIDFDIVPYTLRHAFCVMCRDAGVELNTCRRWMGHADAQMILKVYDSVSSRREETERQKIESSLFKVQNKVQKRTSNRSAG